MSNDNDRDIPVAHAITNAPAHLNVEATTKSDSSNAEPKTRKKTRTRHAVCRIVTNLPHSLPVLPAEIALIAAWWPALADVLSANDNAESGSEGGL